MGYLYLLTTTMERLQEHPCGIPKECETVFSRNSRFPTFVYGKLNGKTQEITEQEFWNSQKMFHPLAVMYDIEIINPNQFSNAIKTSFSERTGNPMTVTIFYMHNYCFVVQYDHNCPTKYWKIAPCLHLFEELRNERNQKRCTKCGYVETPVDVSHEW